MFNHTRTRGADQFTSGDDTSRAPVREGSPIPGFSATDMHSIKLEPLTSEELRDLRKVGRERRSFDDAAREIMRLQLISAVMPPLDDPEALRGLRRRERALLLEVFAAGTKGPDELRLGALLARCAPDHDNLVAMLSTALEFDCMRQGCLAERGYAD